MISDRSDNLIHARHSDVDGHSKQIFEQISQLPRLGFQVSSCVYYTVYCTTPVRVHKLTGCPKILTVQDTIVSIKDTMSLKLFEVQTIINTLFL